MRLYHIILVCYRFTYTTVKEIFFLRLIKSFHAKKIRITCQEHILLEIDVNLPSPMITQQYPDITNAGNSGFESCLTVMNIPLEHELKLHALLEDESIIPLCAISLKRNSRKMCC